MVWSSWSAVPVQFMPCHYNCKEPIRPIRKQTNLAFLNFPVIDALSGLERVATVCASTDLHPGLAVVFIARQRS